MILTESEKGYLAGLLDGEGCVGYDVAGVTKGRPYHSASLQIHMTDPQAVYWVFDTVGCGNISVSQKTGNRKPEYSWQLSTKQQIRELLVLLRPYLKVKADQVDVLFRIWEHDDRLLLPEHRNSLGQRVKSMPDTFVKLRLEAAAQIKALKHRRFNAVFPVEGVETRRAGSEQDQGIVHATEN